MTSKIISTLFALTLTAAPALVHAEGIAVHVAGRSPAAVLHDINAAAAKVCASATRRDYFSDFGSQSECVTRSVRVAVQYLQAAGSDNYTVASR